MLLACRSHPKRSAYKNGAFVSINVSLPCAVAFSPVDLKTFGPRVLHSPHFYLVHPTHISGHRQRFQFFSLMSLFLGAELLYLAGLDSPQGHWIGGGSQGRRAILGQCLITFSPKVV